MTSVRRQIYLSKVAVDRWVVICGSSRGEKVGRRGKTRVGRMPPPELLLTIISAALSAFNIAAQIFWDMRSKVIYIYTWVFSQFSTRIFGWKVKIL